MTDDEIESLTLVRYHWRMRAQRLQRVDIEQDIHLQSFTNQLAKKTKETGSGKNKKSVPVFQNFKDFFDYDKRIRQIEGDSDKDKAEKERRRKLADMAARINTKNEQPMQKGG